MPDEAEPGYSIDTSALVNAWNRHYQIDMFPSIWDHIETIVSEEQAFITAQVYEEIKKKDDDLFDWCMERKDLFTAVDEDHLIHLKNLMERHPRIAASGSGRDFADPWVISLAQCYELELCVVTEEGRSQNVNSPKIPFICEQEGLRSCTFNELLRETGWRERG